MEGLYKTMVAPVFTAEAEVVEVVKEAKVVPQEVGLVFIPGEEAVLAEEGQEMEPLVQIEAI